MRDVLLHDLTIRKPTSHKKAHFARLGYSTIKKNKQELGAVVPKYCDGVSCRASLELTLLA